MFFTHKAIAQKEQALASSTRAILWGLENNDCLTLSSRKEDTDLHQLDLEYCFESHLGQRSYQYR
jgi:hypothetical protein